MAIGSAAFRPLKNNIKALMSLTGNGIKKCVKLVYFLINGPNQNPLTNSGTT